jgi:hypothetical protein
MRLFSARACTRHKRLNAAHLHSVVLPHADAAADTRSGVGQAQRVGGSLRSPKVRLACTRNRREDTHLYVVPARRQRAHALR